MAGPGDTGDTKIPPTAAASTQPLPFFLKRQLLKHLRELLMLAPLGQLDVNKACSPVPRLVAQVRIPHEFLTLEESFSLGEAVAEASEHLLRVASLLHADDP